MVNTQCVIIGCGLAGAATAFQLARRGLRDIIILEQEATEGYHASGRNAAMIRQVVPDPAVAALSREGARFLESIAGQGSWPDLLERRGSLLLAGERSSDRLLEAAARAREAGIGAEIWDPRRVTARVPATERGKFHTAVFTPGDGTVDVWALLQGYLREARAAGVRIFRSKTAREILVDGSGCVAGVKAGNLEISAPRVVNAAGAWASRIAALAGAAPIDLQPRTRHLILTSPDHEAAGDWPFVWNLEEEVYFRPEGRGLLVCPCDQKPAEPGDAQSEPEALDILERKLDVAFPALRNIRVRRYWAGQRTFAQDERCVIGPDPLVRGFHWAAGLGGYGVTTSAAVGALAAETLLDPASHQDNPFQPSRLLDAPARTT